MSSRERLLVVLSLIVVVAAALLWYFTGERERQWVWQPASEKLLTRPLYIAGAWLQQQEVETHDINTLADMLWRRDEQAVLITRQALGTHSLIDRQELREWVESGGHLVIGAARTVSERQADSMLNPHRISRCQSCQIPSDEGMATHSIQVTAPDGTTFELFAPAFLSLDNSGAKKEAVDETTALWRSEGGEPVLATYRIAAGRVSVLADIGWLENRMLIHPDHVRLLEAVVGRPQGPVYLQHRPAGSGLLPWLWRQAPMLWLAGLGLLALWVWRHLIRLGPVRGGNRRSALQMRAHLKATARFDWRYNRARRLVAAMREERRRQLLRRYPDWHQLEPGERVRRIAARCPRHEPASIAWLISARELRTPDDLARYVHLHNDVLKTL